jgi:hypothetical protein
LKRGEAQELATWDNRTNIHTYGVLGMTGMGPTPANWACRAHVRSWINLPFRAPERDIPLAMSEVPRNPHLRAGDAMTGPRQYR